MVFAPAPQRSSTSTRSAPCTAACISTLLDTAAACAVHSTLPVGTGYTTVDLTSTFLRAVRAGQEELRVVGTVLSRGRRTALGQAQLLDHRDRLVAHATSTCLLMAVGAPPAGD